MKLVVATKNKNKIREISDRFSSLNKLEILSLTDIENPPCVIEDGTTFEENAKKRQRSFPPIQNYQSLPTILVWRLTPLEANQEYILRDMQEKMLQTKIETG